MGRKSRASKKRAKEDVRNNNNNVNAEVTMAAAVRRVREILSEESEQKIRETLLQCNLNHYQAMVRLVSLQELRNQQATSTLLPDSTSTTLVSNQSAITNGETRNVPISSTEAVPTLHVPSSSDVTNGETRTVPISSSEAVPPMSSEPSSRYLFNLLEVVVPLAREQCLYQHYLLFPCLCSAITNGEARSVPISSNRSLSEPSSSAITNGETRSVPISSNVAAPPWSMSSSRAPTNVKTKRQATRMISAYGPTMVEVLRGLQQNQTKSPVKADSPLLHQKPDATNPISNSITESDAPKDPQHSAFPMDTRQSIATAFGIYCSSEPHNNQQGMKWRQYGNMINRTGHQQQNRPPPAPIQKRGGSNRNSNTLAHFVNMMNSPSSWLEENDASTYQSIDSVFAQYRNNTMSLSATSTVPSSHGSDYGFDMYAANSRLGYEDVSRIQGRSQFERRVEGEDSNRSISPHNQQEGEAYFERIRAHLASSLDQSQQRETYFERIRAHVASSLDQSQQRPRDK
ncbi:unnamed protein product [Eruca vesicaria subsp. sativa]|uniref:Uncharacterized protein n=1 Tax=Eruca vesicaria subsp. sativa TaxID=29727 RepID=A0ABC8LJI3_ERUVS|nr:unnamed protein product [Eruca vesicaria subsp. sativa]